jgi:3-oxoadipate enol-lactonase
MRNDTRTSAVAGGGAFELQRSSVRVPFDRGSGPPLVVVQGLQGRWEWMQPALKHFSGRCRTIAYSLGGDLGSGWRVDRAAGFDNYVQQLDAVLDRAGIQRAAICGISFGGFVAVRYAATRPERVSALIIVSAPGPGWHPTAQQARWLARPWLSTPAFVATAPFRLWPEISAALPQWPSRMMFLARQGIRVLAAPMIPPLMASRIREARSLDFSADCGRITAPALILTGEERFDRVVPVPVTRRYAALIGGARYQMIENTGHMGLLTQPARVAGIIADFVHAHDH